MDPNDIKKLIAPTGEFNEKAKRQFLAVFDTSALAANSAADSMQKPGRAGMAAWLKALIVIGALAAVMVSVSAYADTKNVAADNPLYPLKRLSENVRLAFTPASEKSQLEATLATRRADEIQDLSTRVPTSAILKGLSVDFQSDVSSSLTENPSSGTPVICDRIMMLASRSAVIRSEILSDTALAKRLEERCEK